MSEVPRESWSATIEKYESLKPYLSRLNDICNRRIASFLRSGLHKRRDIDCLGFIAYIDGRNDYLTNDVEDWEWYAKSNFEGAAMKNIPPGQFVAFFQNMNGRQGGDVEHYALSLGGGCFLQKVGMRAGLCISGVAWISDTYQVTVATPTRYRRQG